MKKIGLLVLFIAAGLYSHAQFEIRPLAGINFGSVQEEPDGVSVSAKAGWQFGGNFLIGGRFHLYPGITYNQQVTEYVQDGSDDVTIDQTVAGVEIPICAGFKFINPEEEDFFNIRVFAGPTMTFHTKTEYSEGFVDDEVEWKDFAWGARVGAGVDLAFLFVDISYDIGLSDAHDVSEALDTFKDTRHNTFLISAGVKLKFGG
jgi:hypothetical protein